MYCIFHTFFTFEKAGKVAWVIQKALHQLPVLHPHLDHLRRWRSQTRMTKWDTGHFVWIWQITGYPYGAKCMRIQWHNWSHKLSWRTFSVWGSEWSWSVTESKAHFRHREIRRRWVRVVLSDRQCKNMNDEIPIWVKSGLVVSERYSHEPV